MENKPKNSAIVLEARDLCKSFDSGKQRLDVLKEVNLQIQSGEKVAIMGASGSGKSTLLHILGTLDRADTGELNLFGEKPPFHSDRLLSQFRNKTIGFVFQFHHLLPEFSALENVMMPCLVADMSMDQAKEKAEKMLVEVGLKDRLSHRPGELSGGEQQRVALARSLVRNPSLLLADEPTGNLDRDNGEMVYDLLHSLNEAYGITILMATHNEQLARRMNRFLNMEDGKLIEV